MKSAIGGMVMYNAFAIGKCTCYCLLVKELGATERSLSWMKC